MFIEVTEYSHTIEKKKLFLNIAHILCFSRLEPKMTYVSLNTNTSPKFYYVSETPEEILEQIEAWEE